MITRLRAPTAWTKQWGPGIALANLYALYDSAGDVTISAETSLPSVLNGPGVVHRFGALTVTTLLHAAVNRCRHAVLLCDSLTMGAAGEISMSGKGAAGHAGLVDQDLVIPSAINFSGKHTSFAAFCAWLRANKYSIFDPNLYASPLPGMGDVLADYAAWPGAGATPIITAAGCGAGGAGTSAGIAGPSGGSGEYLSNGFAGSAGTTGPGGGGGGAAYAYDDTGVANYGGRGGPGRIWGGGQRGLGGIGVARGVAATGQDADPYGQGSPVPGGVLIIIVRGNVSLAAGHAITAAGIADSTTYGGGVGGGAAGLYYGGTLTGTPNMSAPGAIAATGGSATGGAGGAGHTESRTFAQMGWA